MKNVQGFEHYCQALLNVDQLEFSIECFCQHRLHLIKSLKYYAKKGNAKQFKSKLPINKHLAPPASVILRFFNTGAWPGYANSKLLTSTTTSSGVLMFFQLST